MFIFLVSYFFFQLPFSLFLSNLDYELRDKFSTVPAPDQLLLHFQSFPFCWKPAVEDAACCHQSVGTRLIPPKEQLSADDVQMCLANEMKSIGIWSSRVSKPVILEWLPFKVVFSSLLNNGAAEWCPKRLYFHSKIYTFIHFIATLPPSLPPSLSLSPPLPLVVPSLGSCCDLNVINGFSGSAWIRFVSMRFIPALTLVSVLMWLVFLMNALCTVNSHLQDIFS